MPQLSTRNIRFFPYSVLIVLLLALAASSRAQTVDRPNEHLGESVEAVCLPQLVTFRTIILPRSYDAASGRIAPDFEHLQRVASGLEVLADEQLFRQELRQLAISYPLFMRHGTATGFKTEYAAALSEIRQSLQTSK